MSTSSRWAYGELQKLAATVDLPAGRMRLESRGLLPWTNGQSGFTLKHFAGRYEAPAGVLELSLATGRLTGTETTVGSGGERVTRALRGIKVTEYGEIEYRTDTLTVADQYFSMHLGVSRGVLDKDALQMGATRYQKRVSGPPMPFEQNGKWGYKDESGKVAIAARFQVANEFSKEGIAPVVDEKGWAYIDTRGRLLLRPFVVDNGPDYFSDGLARFIANGRVGFFDQTGKIVIPARLAFAAPFSEERAAVCEGCKEVSEGEHRSFRGGRWGYIDRRGEPVIRLQFEEAGNFEQGRARVRAGGQWRYIDKLGKTVSAG